MRTPKKTSGREKIVDLRNHPDPYVTTSDLAAYWRVSRKQIYKQIDAGTLNAIRLGPRLLRIQTSEAIKFEDVAKMSQRETREAEEPRHTANSQGRRKKRDPDRR